MLKRKVKPFTFFLIFISLLFLTLFPKLLQEKLKEKPDDDPFAMEMPKWSGIIKIWDVQYVQTGKGNHVQWLNSYISRFEKKYPGVFIDIRTMTHERLAMYFHGGQNPDILPDIISLGTYEQLIPDNLLTDLYPYFRSNELENIREPALQRVMNDERMNGVPWMMGCYGIFVNMDALTATDLELIPEDIDSAGLDALVKKLSYQKKSGRKTVNHYGFVTYFNSYSRPLLSMIYRQDGRIKDNRGLQLFQSWVNEQGILPPDMITMSYSQAFNMLTGNRAGIMLGNSRVLFDLRKLQETGKNVTYKMYTLPLDEDAGLYQDQIAAYGLMKQDNTEKEQLCILFLKGLLGYETQSKLNELGMFSVIKDIQLYEDDAEMGLLESSLDKVTSTPFSNDNRDAEELWELIISQMDNKR
ncbi:MAG TPA: hypothetical protein GX505_00210 [Clostridiales bacterium]|nr:hypothetical protein [Clostridiales bacterium]